MEVSSHAIAQNRINGLEFTGGIFTNISHDHLDYHKDFSEYLKVKKSFFDDLPPEAFALSNIDDKNGMVMLQNTRAIKHTYALKTLADFKGVILENQLEGLQLRINKNDVWCRLVGTFNAYNLLAVYSAAILLDQDMNNVLTSLTKLGTVEGRFEIHRSRNDITAIVDYAHSPDALKNILDTITSLRTGNEQLITVVGAGGNRDRDKRPVMGRIASEKSNTVILTSDNPRFEDPETIIQEILKGVEPVNFKKVISNVKREEAIKTAYNMAKPGDIILVAGKGHEKYQEIKGVRYPFDDLKIIKELMET
jgi:UDP-N-acetylmuramoyl-L-alanyl-D-glutamate--2,6-diaminopimelate ligase